MTPASISGSCKAAREGVVALPRRGEGGEALIEGARAGAHPALQRGEPIPRLFHAIDHLARVVDQREVGGFRSLEPARECGGAVRRALHAEAAERVGPGLAARVGSGGERFRRLHRLEPPGIEAVDAQLSRRELQHRHLERRLRRPRPRIGHDLGSGARAVRRHEPARRAGGAEAQSRRGQPVDHHFLLEQRREIQIGDQLVRLEQVLERVERARRHEARDRDVAAQRRDVEGAHGHSGAQHRGPAPFQRQSAHPIGEQHPGRDDQGEEQHERHDRLPAEDRDLHVTYPGGTGGTRRTGVRR
jgi:hypothetical protein